MTFPYSRRKATTGLPAFRVFAGSCLLAGAFAFASGQGAPAAGPDGAPPETARDALGAAETPSEGRSDTTAPETSSRDGGTDFDRAGLELYPVRGATLLQRLWAAAGQEGTPDAGRYQILAGTEDSTRRVWLMREGTQVGELRRDSADGYLSLVRSTVAAGDEQGSGLGATSFWKNFWDPVDPLAPFQWNTGLEFNYGWELGVFRNSAPMLARHVDFVVAQRPVPWLTTEFGGHLSRHGGGLRRNLFNPFDERPDWTYWGEDVPWWHAAVGVPGFKWEIALSNGIFPKYYWLDPNASEGSFKLGVARADAALDTSMHYEDGKVMRNWNGAGRSPRPSGGNLAHTLHFKAGQLRYSAHFDYDVYRSAIHEFLFEDIPAPFGNLALGFVASRGAAHSRVRFDMLPLRRGFGPAAADLSARVYFLRIDLDYRDAGSYRIAASTNVLLDGRFLRPESTTP